MELSSTKMANLFPFWDITSSDEQIMYQNIPSIFRIDLPAFYH